MAAPHHRSRARAAVPGVRQRARLQRPAERPEPAGRQPVRQLAGRAGPQDRCVQVALPSGPSRHLGHGQRSSAGARQCDDRRSGEKGPLLRQQVGLSVHARSHQRQAGAAHRIPCGPGGHSQRAGPDAAFPLARAVHAAVRCVTEPRLGRPRPSAPDGAELERLPGRAGFGQPRSAEAGLAHAQLSDPDRAIPGRTAAVGLHVRRLVRRLRANVDDRPERRQRHDEHVDQPEAQPALCRALVQSRRTPAATRRQRPAADRRVPDGCHPRGRQLDRQSRLVQGAQVRPLETAQPAGHRHRPAIPHADGRLVGRPGRRDWR